MRDIKFRGYSKEGLVTENQWLIGFGATTIEYTDDTESTHLITDSGWYEIIKESLSQYTGFKDSKGKEIYEGDILKTKDFYECGELIFKGKVFKVEKINYYMDCCICFNYQDSEIIGNIYENPELLG